MISTWNEHEVMSWKIFVSWNVMWWKVKEEIWRQNLLYLGLSVQLYSAFAEFPIILHWFWLIFMDPGYWSYEANERGRGGQNCYFCNKVKKIELHGAFFKKNPRNPSIKSKRNLCSAVVSFENRKKILIRVHVRYMINSDHIWKHADINHDQSHFHSFRQMALMQQNVSLLV